MNISTSESGTLVLIAIMVAVTVITRWGGIFVMSYVPLNPHVRRFIQAMSGSVLIAMITPMFIWGDIGAKVALTITAVGAIVIKRPFLGIVCGIAIAVWVRNTGPIM